MPPTPHPLRPWALFALTLALGLGGSLALGLLGQRAESARRRQRLERDIALKVQQLSDGLATHEFALRAMAAHFERHPPKTDAEFEAYLRRLDPLRHTPGLHGVTLGLRLPSREVPRLEAEARADRSLDPAGHPEYRRHPEPGPDVKEPVHLIRFAFPQGTNRSALGFDSGSLPDQAEALYRAARTGAPSSTGPVALAQDPKGPPGLVLRMMLYGPGAKAPWGYLNTIWQPKVSLAPSLASGHDHLDLELVDLGLAGQEGAPHSLAGIPLDPASPGFRNRQFAFGGRTLELRIRPQAGAPNTGPIWWPWTLAFSLAALTLLVAQRHWAMRSLALRVQSDLAHTEHQLQAVLNNYPDLLILLNADLTYRDVYTGEESLLLFPKEELQNRRMTDTLPQPLAGQVEAASNRILETGCKESLEYDLELASGPHRFEARGTRLDAPTPEGCGVLWSVRDITAREAAETQLRQREEEFRRFFEAAPSPLLISRMEDGQVLFANVALRRLMEFPEDAEFRGQTPDYYADPAQRRHLIEKLSRDGKLRGEELTLHTTRGRLRQVLLSSDVVHMGGERVLLSAFHDLTGQRASEEVLRQAQKLESLGLMASGIAHDFNNLLAAMQGNLDLARYSPGAPQESPYLDAAEAALQRAADLTRQLLAYSGKAPLRMAPVDLGIVATEMSALLRVSIPKAITLDLNLPLSLPSVEGDRAQLQQVVLNLVSNAADAIGDAPGRIGVRGGTVEFEHLDPLPGQGLSPGPHVWISVSDSGSGMSEEVKSRIFDPFFTTKARGRGLGLSAMQGILRAHRAGLQIDTELGHGSTFILYFPALPAIAPSAARAVAPSRSLAAFSGQALLVDDEPDLRQAMGSVLKALGFEVATAAGGTEALDALRRLGDQLRVVMLDLTMPPPDGTAVLAELRRHHPSLPVILCSGYADAAPEMLGKDPHLGFLAKPYTLTELREELERRLRTCP